MRVLIADDHAVVREGLKRVLSGLPEGVEVGEAGNAQDALALARRNQWDVALLDIAMPGGNGLDLLKQLKREQPALPVLILSMYPEEQYALRVLKAGAFGYLTKESATDQLLTAIQAVRRGQRYASPEMVGRLVAALDVEKDDSPQKNLSDREFEILRLIARGDGVSGIAEKLSLSVSTVGTYRARLLRKLGLRQTAELVAYAVRYGLAE
ncbi:MAG TPA: response regulator transcription factor [Burkholderiales bacterium]|jgi:two-component system invasion response regulator UvrY|nr:response regulator transcription factor [Burkholderiales bacterium]